MIAKKIEHITLITGDKKENKKPSNADEEKKNKARKNIKNIIAKLKLKKKIWRKKIITVTFFLNNILIIKIKF